MLSICSSDPGYILNSRLIILCYESRWLSQRHFKPNSALPPKPAFLHQPHSSSSSGPKPWRGTWFPPLSHHVQSICKPHQSALKTSWTWPFTTTSFFQAIIFLNLGDYNHFLPRLPASSHYPPWSLLSTSARWPFQSFYYFMPCLWLKTLQWLPKAFKTQHDLTLPILALSSSVLPLSFSAPATPPLFINLPGWFLPLGLYTRFSLWKCSPCRPPYGCLPPFI